MAFKFNISEKNGKTFHFESEAEEIIGKEINSIIKGEDINIELKGYELQITGTSDSAGLTAMANVEGVGLKKVILNYGKAMHKKPKGLKKKSKRPPKGLKLRKTVRGKVISPAITQINIKVIKEGHKKLEEIFPDQAKGKSKEEKKEKTE